MVEDLPCHAWSFLHHFQSLTTILITITTAAITVATITRVVRKNNHMMKTMNQKNNHTYEKNIQTISIHPTAHFTIQITIAIATITAIATISTITDPFVSRMFLVKCKWNYTHGPFIVTFVILNNPIVVVKQVK